MNGELTDSRSPGWHPDPTGAHELRYWDGEAWTDDVADGGSPSRDPLRQVGEGGAPPKLSDQERFLLIHVGIALVFLPWLLVVFLIWLSSREMPVQPRFRRVLGLELMIAAGLYGLLAASTLAIAVAARPPSIPADMPSQVLELPEVGSDFHDGLIVYQDRPYELKVVFAEENVNPEDLEDPERSKPILEGLGGYWSGTDAQLSVDGGAPVQGEAAETQDEWPATLRDEAETAFRPEMTAALPLTADDVHRELAVRASMVVEYPYRAGSGQYDLDTTTVSKTAKLFVITPEEKAILDDRQTWRDRSAIILGGVMWFVFAAVAGWAGWRQRRKSLAGT